MHKFLISDFEGPLDLLLHLIKQSKMDIYDIKISEITEQYIDFIKNMESLNLTVASEYLVMASELIEMKSKSLLPKTNITENEDEYIESAEDELSRRLLEYKKYKESLDEFKSLENNRSLFFTKPPENIRNYAEVSVNNDGSVSVMDLIEAFKKILEREELSRPINTKIAKKELSVKERIVTIKSILSQKKKIDFVELFDNITKPYVIVTFLSILEMAKNNDLVIKQENNFEKIYLEQVGE